LSREDEKTFQKEENIPSESQKTAPIEEKIGTDEREEKCFSFSSFPQRLSTFLSSLSDRRLN
jgi:hypothetical protein